MKKGYEFGITLCKCGRAVKDNWMVPHIKSNHKVPKQRKVSAVKDLDKQQPLFEEMT